MRELEDPLLAIADWLAEARTAEPVWSNAMVLATATADGRPSSRAVVVRDIDARGLTFLTDVGSRKARELDANPFASAVLLCAALRRQVVVEGSVVRLVDADADAIFAARPPAGHLALWAWRQGDVVEDVAVLVGQLERTRLKHAGHPLGRPSYWAGYQLRPTSVEFWSEGADGLHERIRHHLAGTQWQVERLAP